MADDFSWLPRWPGETAAIIASGASAKPAPIGLLKGRMRVVAIKDNHQLAPDADVVYGCDRGFWRQYRGLQGYKGLRIAYEDSGHPEVHRINVHAKSDAMLIEPLGTVGSGGNSSFQACNLLVQMGIRRLLLVGLDLQGEHWYGRNTYTGRSNPMAHNFARWLKAFILADAFFRAHGVDVVNASLKSALTHYPRMTIEQALVRWGL